MNLEHFIIFGVGDDQLGTTRCLLNSKYQSSCSVIIHNQQKNSVSEKKYILKVQIYNDIPENIIIINNSLLQSIGIDEGTQVPIHLISSDINFVPVKKLNLQFICKYSLMQWFDEEINSENILKPSLCGDWPQSLESEALKNLLPIFLHKTPLQDGNFILIRALQHLIEFKLRLDQDEEDTNNRNPFVYQIDQYTLFNFDIEKKEDIMVTPYSDCLNYEYFKEAFERIQSSVRLLRPIGSIYVPNRIIVRSLLVSGRGGSGKSIFLKNIYSFYKNQLSESDRIITLIASLQSFSLSPEQLNQLESSRAKLDFHQTLSLVLFSLFPSLSIDDIVMNVVLSRKSLILVIDDWDALFQTFIDAKSLESGNTISAPNDSLKIISYYLFKLLTLIKESDCDYPIFVIGATRFALSQLPRSSEGAPEFEHVVPLAKASISDRQMISLNYLKELVSDLSITEIDGDPLDIISLSERVAKLTRGYYPKDLGVIFQKLRFLHIVKESSEIKFSYKDILNCISTTPLKSLKEMNFSANEQTLSLTWEDFAGYPAMIEKVKKVIRPLMFNSGKSSIQNLPQTHLKFAFPKGMILYGPSGCGKSLVAKIIANELNMNVISLHATELLSKYFGQTEYKIRQLFASARNSSPSVIIIDDFDCLVYKRSSSENGESSHGNIYNRVLSTFLNEMDGITVKSVGIQNNENMVFVIVTCRSIESIDEALLRPGRFQYHILINHPDKNDTEIIFHYFLKPLTLSSSVDIDELIARLIVENPSPSLIESYVKSAERLAINEAIIPLENSNDQKSTQMHESWITISPKLFYSSVAPQQIEINLEHFKKAHEKTFGNSFDRSTTAFQWDSNSFSIGM